MLRLETFGGDSRAGVAELDAELCRLSQVAAPARPNRRRDSASSSATSTCTCSINCSAAASSTVCEFSMPAVARGRNLVFFLRAGFDVWGTDESPEAIARARQVATSVVPRLPADRFRVERVEAMSLADASMDVVISSAVLHFARDEGHWHAMVRELWRVLAPGGMLFARLATSVGQTALRPLGCGRFVMPDGETRFLVDHEQLMQVTDALGASLVDPLKSVVVHNQRSMGTWVLRNGV